jgi:thiosulfate reductase cytochrome b subunit
MEHMKKIYLHPLPVRIWHWTNASCFILLILTGLQIRYVGLIDVVSFRTAVYTHNLVGFVLIGNYFIWLLFYLNSDKIKNWISDPPRKHFEGCFRQMQFYAYGIFVGDRNPYQVTPYSKFNPLQIMLYQVVMLLLVPIQAYTGLMLWDLKHFGGQVDFFGGVRVVDTVHVLIFIFFIFFIQAHVYLATLGHTPTAHIKGMITGYDEFDESDEPRASGETPLRGDTSKA